MCLDSSRAQFKLTTLPCAEQRYHQAEETAMTTIEAGTEIDWMACELIESVPGKVSGRPVVRGTRIMPDAIVGSYELGETIEELEAGFPTLSRAQIERLIDFAHSQPGDQGQ
jgi:uncharacterized protein (DUF433 family)